MSLEWTGSTWNPIAGCTNCYAAKQAERVARMNPTIAKYHGVVRKSGERFVWTGRINLDEKKLGELLRRTKPEVLGQFPRSRGVAS